jgi:hypothetical protein
MSFDSIKGELRRLEVRILFEMVMKQKESKCILNGLCPFYFKHKGYGFCLSEVLAKGCEMQKLEKLQKEICQTGKTFNFTLPLFIFNDDSKAIP